MTLTIPHAELRDGDIAYVQGYKFLVSKVHVSSRQGEKTTLHSTPNRADVIRYVGIALDPRLRQTGYNGGVYGAYADVLITIERTEEAQP